MGHENEHEHEHAFVGGLSASVDEVEEDVRVDPELATSPSAPSFNGSLFPCSTDIMDWALPSLGT